MRSTSAFFVAFAMCGSAALAWEPVPPDTQDSLLSLVKDCPATVEQTEGGSADVWERQWDGDYWPEPSSTRDVFVEFCENGDVGAAQTVDKKAGLRSLAMGGQELIWFVTTTTYKCGCDEDYYCSTLPSPQDSICLAYAGGATSGAVVTDAVSLAIMIEDATLLCAEATSEEPAGQCSAPYSFATWSQDSVDSPTTVTFYGCGEGAAFQTAFVGCPTPAEYDAYQQAQTPSDASTDSTPTSESVATKEFEIDGVVYTCVPL